MTTRDRPACEEDEATVTSAMIEAGVLAYLQGDRRVATDEESWCRYSKR